VTTAAEDTVAQIPAAIAALVTGLLAGDDVLSRARADLVAARTRHREVQSVTRAVVAAGPPGAATRVQALAQERLGELGVRCLHLLRRAAHVAVVDAAAWDAEVRADVSALAALAVRAHRLADPRRAPGPDTLGELIELRRRAARTRSRLLQAAPTGIEGAVTGTATGTADTPSLHRLARYLERVTDLAVSIACEQRNAAGRPTVERRRGARTPRPTVA